MLKIKDNVDLKELEKFGFKFNESIGKWYFENLSMFEYIYINSWNRKIIVDSINGIATSVLFDLIQAGLVEKGWWER